jgi:hypothetical protein
MRIANIGYRACTSGAALLAKELLMNPNQPKDQDRTTIGKYPPNNPREKQREDESTARPEEREYPNRDDEMKDPVGTPETNRPLDDRKGKPAGQKHKPQPGHQPRDDENPLQDPGFESDVLKPGR